MKITLIKEQKIEVEQLKGFYGNLISYCIVIPVLIIINLQSSNNFNGFGSQC
jgi:RNA binding exosome subunit